MISDEVRTMCQTPHPDLHYALWCNLDDSSPIAVSVTQTMAQSETLHILNQIGQLGICASLVLFSLMFVFLDGMYRNHEDDIATQIGQ